MGAGKFVTKVAVKGLKFVGRVAADNVVSFAVELAIKAAATPFAIDLLTVEIKNNRYVPYKADGTQAQTRNIDDYNVSIDDGDTILHEEAEGQFADSASEELLSYKDVDYQFANGFKSILGTGLSSSVTPSPIPTIAPDAKIVPLNNQAGAN